MIKLSEIIIRTSRLHNTKNAWIMTAVDNSDDESKMREKIRKKIKKGEIDTINWFKSNGIDIDDTDIMAIIHRDNEDV